MFTKAPMHKLPMQSLRSFIVCTTNKSTFDYALPERKEM